jgi:hypothetical protein
MTRVPLPWNTASWLHKLSSEAVVLQALPHKRLELHPHGIYAVMQGQRATTDFKVCIHMPYGKIVLGNQHA